MAIVIALSCVLATFAGGFLALRSHQRMHLVLGLSAGLLLGLVSFDLMPEVFELSETTVAGVPMVALAFVGGFLLLHILERASGTHEPLDNDRDDEHGHHHSASGMLGALAMVIHVFLDGVAVALAFDLSTAVGIAVSLAVVSHAFGDGLNTVSLLINSGNWRDRARWLLVLDGTARVSGAVLGSYVTVSSDFLAGYLSMFAGFLVYLATSHILPEAHSRHSSYRTLASTLVGVAAMFAIASLTHGLE